MTAAQRDAVRRARDQARRRALAAEAAARRVCNGCGVGYDERTSGCRSCDRRHWGRLPAARVKLYAAKRRRYRAARQAHTADHAAA